ncbi:hypothetical protein [Vibrio cyclitrophicus]|uniref:hypothetical protein n=1 Tax=Vibrio cyclitrophicus TaxID=47951 RepID=UPI000C8286FB|nr:hypothetical protein [Vibrio cyclitrophicus]PMH76446.1 hypothetical protein BCU59_14005 [Vibrio cyclitrophicus]
MSRLLFLLLFFSFSSNAQNCFPLTKDTIYKLVGGVEYCLESEYQFVYVHNSEYNTGIIELSDIDKKVFDLVYPNESAKVPDLFKITSFDDIQLTVMDGYLYIEQAPKIRKKRSLPNIVTSVVSNLSGSVGTSLAGGSSVQVMPTVVGTLIGTGVGVATGPLAPVVGPLVSSAITQNIVGNQGKPPPPLTIISTTSAPNTNSNFIPRPFTTSGGGGGGGNSGSSGGFGGSSSGGGECTECHS